MFDSRWSGFRFEPHKGTALHQSLLSTGLTQEEPFRHNWKIVDSDIKNQIKKHIILYLNSLHAGYFFMIFWCLLTVLYQFLKRKLSGTLAGCWTGWSQIRPDRMSDLMSVRTVCKVNQQTTKVGAGMIVINQFHTGSFIWLRLLCCKLSNKNVICKPNAYKKTWKYMILASTGKIRYNSYVRARKVQASMCIASAFAYACLSPR